MASPRDVRSLICCKALTEYCSEYGTFFRDHKIWPCKHHFIIFLATPTSTNTTNLPFQIRENCNAPIQSQPVAIVVINYRVYFQAALHERTPPAYAEPDGSNGASRQAAEGQAETGQQTGKHDKNCCNAIGDAYPAPQTWNQSTNDKPRRGWQYGQCQLPAEYSRPRHSFLRFRLGARHRTITYYLFIQNSGLLTRCTNANNSQAIGVTKYTLHLF